MCSAQFPAFHFMANFAQRLKELRSQRKLTRTRLADTPGVRLGVLAGRKDVASEAIIGNPERNRLSRKVAQLADEDQRALLVVLDSLVKRSRITQAMAAV